MPHCRTVADLDRAIRAVAAHFDEDAVVVIGSQAALVGWPYAPDGMRDTPEIDIYLVRARLWEERHPGEEASEEIAGLFGQDTPFNTAFGFFIDGVDSRTATLPSGWEGRAVFREVKNGSVTVTAIAPSLEDLVVSKMRRLADKDSRYINACHLARPLDLDLIKERISQSAFTLHERIRAEKFLDALPRLAVKKSSHERIEAPHHPEGTHKAFWDSSGLSVFIREYDEISGLYYKVGNTLGPAFVSGSAEAYSIGGKKMSKEAWEQHPDVISARKFSRP